MISILKGLLRWLRLFPGIVFTHRKVETYLTGIKNVMLRHDMVKADSEDYFHDRYMAIINSIIESKGLSYEKLKILDAGCGQGRLSISLALKGSCVDAVDCIPELLEKAKVYAQERNLKNDAIRWIRGEIPYALNGLKKESYDLALCTEVLLMLPNPEEAIVRVYEMLKYGGILFISFRSRLYYLLHSLIHNDFLRLKIAYEKSSFKEIGHVLSWFDPQEADRIFAKLDLDEIKRWGIGMLTGIEGDPTAKFCKPAELNSQDRILVGKVEDSIAQRYFNIGRYIVFSGVKR